MIFRLSLLSFIALAAIAAEARAETTVQSSINWTTGEFHLRASMPLGSGKSPDDHPRALEEMERELLSLAVIEFGRLAWDNRGTLDNLMKRDPEARTSVEGLASSLKREWSRLTDDYGAIEAAYVLDLGEILPRAFPSSGRRDIPGIPIGWRPIPEDDWTGIVIYVPDGLKVRGTGLISDAVPALRARILTDNLDVLADPSTGGNGLHPYSSLEDRESADVLVGRRPYRVMARGLYGDYACDIILPEEDSLNILASESGRRALTEGRIVILMDKLPD